MSNPLRTTAGLAATIVALAGVRAFAQEPAPEAARAALPEAAGAQVTDEVVVRGRRMSEVEFDLQRYVRTFINEVAAPPPGRGYARWHREVCIGVDNVQEKAAQYIADRVSRLALEVGLEPGEPGCRPDVIIIFTTDGKQTASFMVENAPRLFRPGGPLSGLNLTLEALDDFAAPDRAGRGGPVSVPGAARRGQRALKMAGDNEPPVVSVAGPSRLHNGTRDDMFYVIVVVDATKLLGKTWQQIGDYLAVVSLAQIDPGGDLSEFDSILNLFENPLAYSGLTDWVRSYMRAFYAFDQERVPGRQADEIVSRMTREESEVDE